MVVSGRSLCQTRGGPRLLGRGHCQERERHSTWHPSIYLFTHPPTHPSSHPSLGPSGIRHQIDTRHDMSRVSRGRQIDRCQIPTPVGLELSVRSYSPSGSDGSDCVPFDLCCLSISSSPVRTPRNPTDRAGDCWGALSCQAFASVGKPP